MNQIFKNLKVVELANVLAGPSVGMFFAELGAEVIKIENPRTGGDITRKWKLPSEDPNKTDSAYYSCVNYGKTAVFLDVTDRKDRSKVDDLIREADVVVSNFKPSFRSKHKMGYEALALLKPDLIYAELNAYPDIEKPAFDILLQAETGYLAMCGTNSSQLAKIPVALIDVIAGHQLKEGVLIALLRKYQTGQGAYVKTSLYESAIASLINQAANYLQSGFVPQPNGTTHSNIAPYGDVYYDIDGHALVLAVGTEKQFSKLLTSLELEHNEHWATNQLRLSNRASLNQAIQGKMAVRNRNQISDVLTGNGVPFAYIKSIKEVLDDRERTEILTIDNELVKSIAFEID